MDEYGVFHACLVEHRSQLPKLLQCDGHAQLKCHGEMQRPFGKLFQCEPSGGETLYSHWHNSPRSI